MRSAFLMALMMALVIMPTAQADSVRVCIDDSRLNQTDEIQINGNTTVIGEVKDCPHGCSEDFQRCKPSPFTSNTGGFILSFVLLGLLMFILPRMDVDGELHPVAMAKASLIPLAFVVLGFIDIFEPFMRTIFGIMALGTLLIIVMAFRLIRKSPKNIQNDSFEVD